MALYRSSFRVLLKLNWYQLKLDCYKFKMLTVTPFVNIKKISLKYTQKEVKRNRRHKQNYKQIRPNRHL